MRNSPIVNVIEYLHGKGYDIEIFDKNVSLSRLIGKNKSVISEKLPHLDKMLKDDLQDVCCHAELLVISNKDEQFKTLQLRPGQKIFDLVRIKELESSPDYKGLCW